MRAKRSFRYRRHTIRFIGVGSVFIMLALLAITVVQNVYVTRAHGVAKMTGAASTQNVCVTVAPGDTLGRIAVRLGTSWVALASFNHLANPDIIISGQIICTPSTKSPAPTAHVPIGHANLFPPGQCTWYANQRYAELHHHAFVPWTINSDAWQWEIRAQDFGWHVSFTPTVGAIIDLQANTQGASPLGHVGVVERILPNNHVIVSSLNWGLTPEAKAVVSNSEFAPGPGVTFISQQ